MRELSMGIVGKDSVERQYHWYFKHLLSKLHELFIVENLPEKWDNDYFLNCLFLDGQVGVADFNGNLYCVRGNPGGEPNEYYEPTIYTVANPVLGSKQFTINRGEEDNAVVVWLTRADKEFYGLAGAGGLTPLIHQTATLLADNIVSINAAQINSRVQAMVAASNPEQVISAEVTMKRLYEGEPYAVMEQDLIDQIKVNPLSTSTSANSLQQLIETQQFLIAQFYQNLGIKANAINKKERLITDEINAQDDFLNVSYNVMFNSIAAGIEAINNMFGTSIEIKKPAWLTGVETEEEAEEREEKEEEEAAMEEVSSESSEETPEEAPEEVNDDEKKE